MGESQMDGFLGTAEESAWELNFCGQDKLFFNH